MASSIRGAIQPQSPASSTQSESVGYPKIVRNIRRLIWLYIVLLVLEGALRKWVVPQFSNPLLIIRDPVVILIYILALRASLFPWNGYVISLGIIAVCSAVLGFLVLSRYFPWTPNLLVTSYGFRSNFLHLPLIFVMAKVLDGDDVKKIGWWILVGMIPMSIIMVAQFQASPDAFINRTVGLGEALQLDAGGGKIRPPGTFSFVSGAVLYVAAATAFLIYGALTLSTYKTWLLIGAGFAVVIAVTVSGSRSSLASTLLVVLSVLVILIIRPQAVNRFGRSLLVIVIAALIITRLPVFKEGVGILSERFTASAQAAETTIVRGLFERTLGEFTQSLKGINKLPLSGWGLGVGTAGGARFLVGRAAFLLSEGEWQRVLLESGPILGLAFLLWRTVLTFKLGYLSLVALTRGAILPILLFSCGFLALLNGQFGQPTSLGFAVILSGFCLAVIQSKRTVEEPGAALSGMKHHPKRILRRSEFASRLHEPGVAPDRTNGSLDR